MAKTKEVEAKIIGVKELAEELGVEPSKLRRALRESGQSAPATETEGFGPKAKYQFTAGKELDALKKTLKEKLAEMAAKKDAPKE